MNRHGHPDMCRAPSIGHPDMIGFGHPDMNLPCRPCRCWPPEPVTRARASLTFKALNRSIRACAQLASQIAVRRAQPSAATETLERLLRPKMQFFAKQCKTMQFPSHDVLRSFAMLRRAAPTTVMLRKMIMWARKQVAQSCGELHAGRRQDVHCDLTRQAV